jgi:hypothetical protein
VIAGVRQIAASFGFCDNNHPSRRFRLLIGESAGSLGLIVCEPMPTRPAAPSVVDEAPLGKEYAPSNGWIE